MTKDTREAFEAYWADNLKVTAFGQQYHAAVKIEAESAWQAATRSASEEIERLKADREAEMESLWKIIEPLRADLAMAVELVRELSDDVVSEVEERYANTKEHPAMLCLYERDIETANKAKSWLERLTNNVAR